ncbi:RnfABCDGE type electron transport complex subunit D [Cellulosilyticum sp. I15G10I2]|uniref:RnfABCDGE type electron transport complex subunit D n=1 Tax=Cellulosilyticum sp. I15G10I2 TaxID=1892843 RepID=UPI00085C24DB|nr:RnfABCDGE type electron transport complex subunit D [Cellulosilyticum sp. I15G10I2]
MKNDYPAMLHRFAIGRQMQIFAIALLPLVAAGMMHYGMHVLWMLITSYVAAFCVEFSFAKIRHLKVDAGAIVTPLIFTLVLPPTLPLWIVAVGSAFGVFFGKAIFGGLGKNIFNPAIVGRLFITISFPAFMATMWLDPKTDAITTASPLGVLNRGQDFNYGLMDLLIGGVPGSVGETFRLGIIIIGIILILMRIVNWRIPVFFIGSVFLITWAGSLIWPGTYKDPFLSILVGGILFGAFFVASDPITSPYTQKGRMLYGIGLGIITVVIRNFAAFPEGVMFAVIIMNAVSPLLDDMVLNRPKKREAGVQS